jgi:steroid delta-isomerase
MSIGVLEHASPHPARDFAIRSIQAVESSDRESWLAMWDENGVIEDPVGMSPLDPEGQGHHGIEKITAFYDKVIGPGELRFCIRETFACGNECANVGTITTKLPNGVVARTELVMIYRISDQGTLLSLRAFWEFNSTVASTF